MSDSYNLKKERRENEQLFYQRAMFWHQPEAQELIKQLLQKIYDLEDKMLLMKNERSN